jgi:hypothetical protein
MEFKFQSSANIITTINAESEVEARKGMMEYERLLKAGSITHRLIETTPEQPEEKP